MMYYMNMKSFRNKFAPIKYSLKYKRMCIKFLKYDDVCLPFPTPSNLTELN